MLLDLYGFKETHPLAIPLPDLLIVSVYCTLLLLSDDTSSTVHPVSVLNEENEHSKHTLPPVVSVITTDSTPNVSEIININLNKYKVSEKYQKVKNDY